MPLATLNKISKIFGQRILFADASLNIYRGQRIGLVVPDREPVPPLVAALWAAAEATGR